LYGSLQATESNCFDVFSLFELSYFFSPSIALADTVVVNEVGDKGNAANACVGADYVELLNVSPNLVNIAGFALSDDQGMIRTDKLVFSAEYAGLESGEFRVLCKGPDFDFGIGGTDTVTLFDTNGDVVSTSGVLQGRGSDSLSFQRKSDGTYAYAKPTLGAANVFPPPIMHINEVAPHGSSGVCSGGDWVELLNDSEAIGDLNGYVLTDGTDTYTIPDGTTIDTYLLVCVGFDISAHGTISLKVANDGEEVSSSGKIGGDAVRCGKLVWARKVDVLNSNNPFDPFFAYSVDATPEAPNVFPFEATNVQIQECGKAKNSYGAVSNYNWEATYNVGENPEFSGGSFYGGTCTHWIFGDEGYATELDLSSLPEVRELRTVRLVGGSGDTEGSCFYTDKHTGVTKIVYVDERERSVALCDIPTAEQDGIIYRESSNCRVIKLTTAQFDDTTLTSSDPNEGFEGVGKYMPAWWPLFPSFDIVRVNVAHLIS
jgi:hypothetical protein